MAECRGVLAAQSIKPQARTLAEGRDIACVEVDLAVLRGEREPLDALPLFARCIALDPDNAAFLAGYGLGAWLMWKHFPAGADALAPEACFAICAGLLTGTGTAGAYHAGVIRAMGGERKPKQGDGKHDAAHMSWCVKNSLHALSVLASRRDGGGIRALASL